MHLSDLDLAKGLYYTISHARFLIAYDIVIVPSLKRYNLESLDKRHILRLSVGKNINKNFLFLHVSPISLILITNLQNIGDLLWRLYI